MHMFKIITATISHKLYLAYFHHFIQDFPLSSEVSSNSFICAPKYSITIFEI